MSGVDSPSFDGKWNKENRTSTWFSPNEIYDRNNKCEEVAWSGFDWQYVNDKRRFVRYERRWQFKDDDWNPLMMG